MTKKEISTFIKQLKAGELERSDILREVRNDDDFKEAERRANIRIPDKRGFDVINNCFFVEEILIDGDNEIDAGTLKFNDFGEFYGFLRGKIYDKSCYYGYSFDKEAISKYDIDLEKLKNTHFTDKKIDPSYEISNNDLEYQEVEKSKKQFNKWLEKFIACNDAAQFDAVQQKYEKSKCCIKSMRLVYCLMIMNDADKAFSVLMDMVNHNWGRYYLVEELCLHYGAQKVLDTIDIKIDNRGYKYRIKKKITETCNNILNWDFAISCSKGFDEKTHFYYVIEFYECKENKYEYYRKTLYFDDFQLFSNYLNDDLSDCDLSRAKLDIDFDVFITNKKTVLPAGNGKVLYSIEKKCSGNNAFSVNEYWADEKGNILDKKTAYFYYFFDFVYYLEGNLSDTDFTMCEGIVNLNDISGLEIKGCTFRSDFLRKFGLKYKKTKLPEAWMFDITSKNEENTELSRELKNELRIESKIAHRFSKISYITDIHLVHALQNYNCITKEDVTYVLKKTANTLSKKAGKLLIGGDLSSDFKYFEKLLDMLKSRDDKYFDEDDGRDDYYFILGNHELWDFEGSSFDSIVKKYRKTIEKHGYYLLQNSIIYETPDRKIHEIDEKTLKQNSIKKLRTLLRTAQFIILGGLAFSGYNEEFNAEDGIYRNTISRDEEIRQTKIFNDLYKKVCEACFDKNVIVFTHTPKRDWSGNEEYQPGFIYVNGHTHRNHFYDDGSVRIYADNQIGYKKKTPFLKYFFVERETDYFADYEDGIYEITKGEYNTFYQCKSIGIDYNREGNVIMLKRNGYYAFFKESKYGLCILNGGALKKMDQDINYYYDKMIDVIERIRKPLQKYTDVQKKIAEQIKIIGGSGYIHGCIIDINFLTHIYVNPYDLTITGYFAYDIISKEAYKNVPSLLKAKCPMLYANYKKLLAGKKENALVASGAAEIDLLPEYYPDTDIYKASREIRKMQKLESGILTAWYDIIADDTLIDG